MCQIKETRCEEKYPYFLERPFHEEHCEGNVVCLMSYIFDHSPANWEKPNVPHTWFGIIHFLIHPQINEKAPIFPAHI